ncbi:unnamed protein product [Amaranthus hypochondriacus]
MGYFLLKATTITITTLLIVLLQVFVLSSAGAAAGQDDDFSNAVYLRDENGELMLNGGTYYLIRRINRQDAGGLTVVPDPQGSSCPLYITQEKDTNSNGIPVKISSHMSTKYLPYGTTEFTFVGVNTECNEPLVWRVRSDSATGHDYVAVGTPDWSRLPGAFYILTPFNYVEPFQYEINFCDHRSVCGRANFQGENGHLAINNELDVVFRFRKVSNNESPMLINYSVI